MRWTKPIWRLVSRFCHLVMSKLSQFSFHLHTSELGALGEDFGEEEEIPSYLRDTNALPDFVDEDPVPAQSVSLLPAFGKQPNRMRVLIQDLPNPSRINHRRRSRDKRKSPGVYCSVIVVNYM
jgi:hypothetical protein